MGLPGWPGLSTHLPVREPWAQSWGREDPLEKEMATHANILAWEIPWTEESGGLQSMGLQRVRYHLATEHVLSTAQHGGER